MSNIKNSISKPFFKKWWFWVLAIIIIAVIVNGNNSETTSNTTKEKKEETSNKNNTSKKKVTNEKIYKIGESIKVGKFTYVVKNIEEKTKLSSILGEKSTSGKFIIVELDVKNGDDKSRIVDGEMFKIKSSGKEYGTNAELDMYVNEGGGGFLLQEVNPGISKLGSIVFEVPSDLNAYNLELSSGLGWSSGEYKTVKVK